MLIIRRFVKEVFPKVKEELHSWQLIAEKTPDSLLSQQALASLQSKAFHCLGGSIYALYPGAKQDAMIQFIVAYQTISDYLDNLVDAANVQDEKAFAQLHLAMTEALDPEAECSDYYAEYPYKEDGGYLDQLVRTCQENLKLLPSYSVVKAEATWLAAQYSSLQTYKHLKPEEREEKMLAWLEQSRVIYSEVSVWEFAAATGSTLGIFCLVAAAHQPGLTVNTVKAIKQAYFPWICGLHILLDYFIDYIEDRETDQLNFVQYYPSISEREKRLVLFLQVSLERAHQLSNPEFHLTVVNGLIAMYLSDPKSEIEELNGGTRALLSAGGIKVRILHWLCVRLRRKGVL
ncbi:tetraprenyl-beta-curcumene synthase family protein [Desulfitobacterium sp.]|uniref:tetraprenyl-beta-curcumene synthase family protein n=1 Tax=Desulfitobacterium sp. TaxID=49981 RepID=UPI002B209DA1|nr:tetraprenyl-beta-curcumene synthase family protein [Desulfitobacterium sp.]MEA4901143.1 tetraprenyl-beta-curcumene synthase family protein [Desulfitobacterium sp.]